MKTKTLSAALAGIISFLAAAVSAQVTVSTVPIDYPNLPNNPGLPLHSPYNVVVDALGNLYVSDGSIYANTIRKGVLAGPPVITQQPQGASAVAGWNVQLSVSAGAVPDPTYQWYFQGNPINGAASSSYTLSNIQPAAAGEYYVTVTNDLASVPSTKAVVTVTAASVAVPPQTQGGGGSCEPWFVLALVGLGFGAIARRRIRSCSSRCAC